MAYGARSKALAVVKNPTAKESPISKKAINTQAARFQTSFSTDIFHTPYVCYLGHADAVSVRSYSLMHHTKPYWIISGDGSTDRA
jgi:hypothetical protein